MSELIKTIAQYPWPSFAVGMFLISVLGLLCATISDIFTKNNNS